MCSLFQIRRELNSVKGARGGLRREDRKEASRWGCILPRAVHEIRWALPAAPARAPAKTGESCMSARSPMRPATETWEWPVRSLFSGEVRAPASFRFLSPELGTFFQYERTHTHTHTQAQYCCWLVY